MKRLFLFFLIQIIFLKVIYAQTIIRFATEATYPPFEYIDDQGNIKGFDIDIAKALCNDMKVQCEFSNQSFSSLIPSLNIGKFDAVIAAIGVTPERLKEVDFTDAYYEPSASFVGNKNTNITLDNLQNKKIGVQIGTTFERYLNDKFTKTVDTKHYISIQNAFLDLISGRIDLVLADTPIARTWLTQANHNQAFMIIGKPIIDHDYFGSGYAIAIAKNNKILLNQLNQALKSIKEKGIYEKINAAYFGIK